MAKSAKVIIIGSGVAGPATALALKMVGIDAVIYEAYPGPGDAVGTFLGITPNGQDVLRTLGVYESVLADGFQTNDFHFATTTGKSYGTVPANTITIQRGHLTRALREKALDAGVKIEWNKRLRDVQVVDGHNVIAKFEDGTQVSANALIACDGIHSQVRQAVLPNSPHPAFTGLLSCSAYSRDTDLPSSSGQIEMVFGKKAFFSYLVKPSGDVFWFANLNESTAPTRGELEKKGDEWWHKRLKEAFADDQPFISDIITKSQTPIIGYPIYDLATIPQWQQGPVCLIGDAAHAPSPSAGQGASMALEDGLVMAQCLRDIADTEVALTRFVELRKDRAEKIVAQSRRNGSRKTPTSAFGRFMRDLLLPIFLKQGGDATKWMYDYHIDFASKIKK